MMKAAREVTHHVQIPNKIISWFLIKNIGNQKGKKWDDMFKVLKEKKTVSL